MNFKSLKSYLSAAIKIVFAAGIIAWMIQKGLIDFSVFKIIFTPLYLILSLFLIGSTLLIASYRWLVLLRSQNFDLDLPTVFKLTLIGIFFNFAIPGGVGGDVVKGYYLVKDHPERKLAAAMTVLMDRIVGLFAMVLMPTIVLLMDLPRVLNSHTLTLIFISTLGFLLFFIIFFGISFLKKSREIIDKMHFLKKIPMYDRIYQIYRAVHSYGEKQKAFWTTVILSIIGQSVSIFFIYIIGQAMGLTEIPLNAYYFATTVGFIVTAIPISPAGVGVGQAAFYYLFNLYLGYETQLGSTSVTALQMIMLAYGFVGAFYYIRWKKNEAKNLHSTNP